MNIKIIQKKRKRIKLHPSVLIVGIPHLGHNLTSASHIASETAL
jgi:hypothetical protein